MFATNSDDEDMDKHQAFVDNDHQNQESVFREQNRKKKNLCNKNFVCGMIYAALTGIFGGSILVPLGIAQQTDPATVRYFVLVLISTTSSCQKLEKNDEILMHLI